MNNRKSLGQPMDELLELIRFVERVSTKLHALPDESSVYRTVCDEFARSGRYSASIMQLTPDGAKLRIAATSNPSRLIAQMEQLSGLRMHEFTCELARAAIYRRVVETGKSAHVMVEDIIHELFPAPVATLVITGLGYRGKSSILVPIWDHDEVIAVLGISAPILAEEFIPTVETLARHVTNALYAVHERKLREQTERALFERQRELTARTRILEAILHSFDLEHRLMTILTEILSFLRVEMGGIYLREREKFVLRKWYGIPDEVRSRISPLSPGEFPLPPESEPAIVVHEQLSESGTIPEFMKTVGIQTFASIYLSVEKKDGPVGVLVLACRRCTALSAADIHALETMGHYLALAIDGAHHFQHAEQRLARLEVLREIDRAIISRLSIQRIMEIVLKNVPASMGADAVAISLFDGGRIQVQEMRLPNGTLVQQKAFDLSEEFRDWFIERQEPVVIHDLMHDSRARLNRDIIQKYKLASYLGVPLVADGETIGVLHIVTVRSAVFAPEDVEFFQTLAGQAAIAIKSARLFAEIERAEKRYRGIFDNAAEGIYQATLDGTLIIANQAMAEILGYESPEELLAAVSEIGQLYVEPTQRTAFMDQLKQTGIVQNFKTQMRRRDGTTVWVSKSARLIRDEGEQALHYESICEDITAQREMEVIRTAKEIAEAANRAKSQFLANMSHELRTPLNAIIGFSQVLQDKYFGPLTEKQAEYVNDILESGKHLLALINDILDLAKIEAGREKLELSLVEINKLLEDSLMLIREKARAHGISVTLNVPPDLEKLSITADERKLKQVLLNLLSNATKFTPDGGAITVEAQKTGQELTVSISDTGIGIAPDDQSRIFEEFYQAGTGTTAKSPGTGLGLAISKRIVEMHGGRIGVESDGIGKGSRFYFTLPLIAAPEDPVLRGAAFRERLTGVLDQARRYGWIFTVCEVRGIADVLQEQETLIKDIMTRESRAYDFCGFDSEGRFYLVFPEIGREQAKIACNRILSELKKVVPDATPRSYEAVFPEDGATIAELMESFTGKE